MCVDTGFFPTLPAIARYVNPSFSSTKVQPTGVRCGLSDRRKMSIESNATSQVHHAVLMGRRLRPQISLLFRVGWHPAKKRQNRVVKTIFLEGHIECYHQLAINPQCVASETRRLEARNSFECKVILCSVAQELGLPWTENFRIIKC